MQRAAQVAIRGQPGEAKRSTLVGIHVPTHHRFGLCSYSAAVQDVRSIRLNGHGPDWARREGARGQWCLAYPRCVCTVLQWCLHVVSVVGRPPAVGSPSDNTYTLIEQ